jgi:hypothetical protein
MSQYIVKIILTAAVVVAVSELARRSTLWGAVLASLPLISLLAFIWLYFDTSDTQRVADLSLGIFWLVLPSLPLFLVLTLLLRSGFGFWSSLGAACLTTLAAYTGMLWALGRFGIRV